MNKDQLIGGFVGMAATMFMLVAIGSLWMVKTTSRVDYLEARQGKLRVDVTELRKYRQVQQELEAEKQAEEQGFLMAEVGDLQKYRRNQRDGEAAKELEAVK